MRFGLKAVIAVVVMGHLLAFSFWLGARLSRPAVTHVKVDTRSVAIGSQTVVQHPAHHPGHHPAAPHPGDRPHDPQEPPPEGHSICPQRPDHRPETASPCQLDGKLPQGFVATAYDLRAEGRVLLREMPAVGVSQSFSPLGWSLRPCPTLCGFGYIPVLAAAGGQQFREATMYYQGAVEFAVNRSYAELSGTLFVPAHPLNRSGEYAGKLTVRADGRVVYQQEMWVGSDPTPFRVPLKGVQRLNVHFESTRVYRPLAVAGLSLLKTE